MKFGFFRYARHICLLNLLWLAEAHGQSSQIVKEFHKDQGKRNRDEVYASINRMVQNPLLASGLVSGTESLNRSVESLMESLFYSIMDQDLRVSATDNMDITSEYKRDVHTANIGGYVVVDRFQLGPGFLKNLGEIRGLPLTFSAQGRLFITNASHRSDAQRKSETQKNGFWPNLVANWLGLLPLMSYLLPPSFNPEELYDPVSYLSTPFLFPTNIEEALKLPLGNVRSYGLSGNATFTLDTAGRAAKSLQSSLGLNDLDLTIPLSLFRDGEHRITILRRDESHVWLSLSETRRIGGSIAMPLGKHYRILQKLVSWWTGVSAPISPISFDLEKSRVYRIDELYDFNLLLAEAQDAFVKALHGDFQYVRALTAQEAKPEKLANGIEFQFRRITTRDESGHKQERSLYVAQKQKQNRFGVGESVTRDPDGEFLTLEAEHTAYDRAWNVLVGSDTVEFHHRLSIPVRKEIGPDKRSLLTLVTSTENPIYLTASLRIIDSFVDTRDYHRTLGMLRRYTGLSLKEAPEIPTYAEDLRQNLIREQALANPMNDIYRQQITATHLGKLASNAHIYFSHDIMLALARLGPSVLWTSLAKAFELDSEEWKEKGPREGFS
ncbi:MAG: hypothetical protein NTX25_15805, partial [Proteobacteria bacterium]|nr:hypothetical protein [Pseudomonadota bacterium]